MPKDIARIQVTNKENAVIIEPLVELFKEPAISEFAEQTRNAIFERSGGDRRPVVINLSEATFMPSTTLGDLLIPLNRRLQSEGRTLVLVVDPAGPIMQALIDSRFNRLFKIAPTVEIAIEHTNGQSTGRG